MLAPNELRILQNNLHKSNERTNAMLNDPDTNVFTIIMLQEQYWSMFTKSSTTHHAWNLYEPINTATSEMPPRAAIYVNRTHLPASAIAQLPIPSTDVVAIEVKPTNDIKPSLLINVYNPNDKSVLPTLEEFFKNYRPDRYETVIMAGDFNCHHPLWNPPGYDKHDIEADKLVDLASTLGLNLLMPPGTITFPRAKTAIDLVWGNHTAATKLLKCKIAKAYDVGSDHLPIETHLTAELMDPPDVPSKLNFKKANWNEFNRQLQQKLPKITRMHTQHDIDKFLQQLTMALHTSIESTTPKCKPCPHSKRWWNADITKLMKKAKSLRNKYHRTNHYIDRIEWEKADREYRKEIERAKRDTWRSYLENADGQSIWQIKNYVMETPMVTLVPTLDGQAQTHEEKICALQKTFFPPPPPADISDLSQRIQYPLPVLCSKEITVEQIRTAVRCTAPNKAPGPDGLTNRVLQQALPLIDKHLQSLAQATIDVGYFPKQLRHSTTIVLRKPGKPDYTKSKAYRPIALENTIGKILESVIAKILSYLVENNSLLPRGHYGARPGRSTEDAMMHLSESIHAAWKEQEVFTALYLDVAGAFNNVHHGRLIHNLRKRKVPLFIVNWVKSFLEGRSTQLSFNGSTSKRIPVPAGVPQGSPLSPLLYLFYNADALEVADGIPGSLSMGFVDDIVYGVKGKTDRGNVSRLEKMVERAEEWRKRHGVQFEPTKYVLVHYTRNWRKSTTAEVKVGETIVKPATEARYLGVIFDKQLRFKPHLQHVVKKGTAAALALSRIANCKRGVPYKYTRQLYQAVVVPRIDYATAIWHRPDIKGKTANSSQAKSLSTIQRIAMKAITGAYRTTPTEAMEIESGLLPPWLRLQSKALTAIIRMKSLATKHPIHKWFRRATSSKRSAAYKSNIENILDNFPITQRDVETVRPFAEGPPWVTKKQTLTTRNRLDFESDEPSETAKSLSKEVKANTYTQWTETWGSNESTNKPLRKIITNGGQHGPKFYSKMEGRQAAGWIMQLRTGHCGLNKYLHRFGHREDSNCEGCGTDQETVEHYLLECPKYQEERRKLVLRVNSRDMRVDKLLGDLKLAQKVVEYIRETRRFEEQGNGGGGDHRGGAAEE
jgi:hypothetical protein